MSSLVDIRKRDAELHYCATCGNRVYSLTDDSEPHNFTIEECDRRLRNAGKKQGTPREPRDGHLCWTPEDHHPFAEGAIPDYKEAARDRRDLLAVVDDLLASLSGAAKDFNAHRRALIHIATRRHEYTESCDGCTFAASMVRQALGEAE